MSFTLLDSKKFLYHFKFKIMYLGTVNGVDYYHVNTGVEAKKTIYEISENPVEFVTEDYFDIIVDRQHEKAEYIVYYNSMC
jgi:hypothetical protein